MPVEVPESVRRKVRAEGEAAAAWLDGLDGLVAELEAHWEVRVGAPLAGGTAAYVAEATTADGGPAVVKLAMPAPVGGRADLAREVAVLLAADGEGCVRVLAFDADRGAVLLERLGRPLAALGLPADEERRVVCSTLARLWGRPPPLDAGLRTGDDKGRWLVAFIARAWEELGRPCPASTVEAACAAAERRIAGFRLERAVLVHGDAHAFNTLDAGSGRFALVDPEGLVAEREHDLAIPMRELDAAVLGDDPGGRGRAVAHRLAQLTGTDAAKVWDWGLVERVSTALYGLQQGHEGWPLASLAIAGRWAEARG